MVSDSPSPAQNARDRAQLILIGAIALAFIILGVVVVFNSVLYTQTMSSSSSIETTSDARLAELEMARGVQGIAQEVNLNSSTDDITGRSEAFVNQYQNVTAERRPAIVNLAVSDDTQASAISRTGFDHDEIFNSTNRPDEVGHFTLIVDPSSFSETQETRITKDGSTGTESWIEVEFDGSEFTVENGSGEICSVESTGSRIQFDFISGSVNRTGVKCPIQLIEPDEGTETIEMTGAGSGGGYELVAKGDEELVDGTSGNDAAWTVDLEYTYDTSELSVDRQFEVEVYGDRR